MSGTEDKDVKTLRRVSLERDLVETRDTGYITKVKRILTDYAAEIGTGLREVAFGLLGSPFAPREEYHYVIGTKQQLSETRLQQIENNVYPRLGGIFIDLEWLDAKEASIC